MTDEQRQANTREATKSHDPAPDHPSPNAKGSIEMPSQQCVALTQRGTACRRRTKRGHHCADHMRLLQRLAIRKSTIDGAGLGLFAAKGRKAQPFAKGQRIALYTGDWAQLLPGSAGDEQGGPYYLQITRRLAVDAAHAPTQHSVAGPTHHAAPRTAWADRSVRTLNWSSTGASDRVRYVPPETSSRARRFW